MKKTVCNFLTTLALIVASCAVANAQQDPAATFNVKPNSMTTIRVKNLGSVAIRANVNAVATLDTINNIHEPNKYGVCNWNGTSCFAWEIPNGANWACSAYTSCTGTLTIAAGEEKAVAYGSLLDMSQNFFGFPAKNANVPGAGAKITVTGADLTPSVIQVTVDSFNDFSNVTTTQSSRVLFPSTRCTDTRDNDGDGRIDALFELPAVNDEKFDFGVSDPFVLVQSVEKAILDKKFTFLNPGAALVNDDATAAQACRIMGFKDVVAKSCASAAQGGRCNFVSPENNVLARWNGTAFAQVGATGQSWIASLSCKNRIAACSDGWDNDGDGKVDRADSGCVSDADDSELVHDAKCATLASPVEAEECRNGADDDNDALIDRLDPGCWTNPNDPNTYNPDIDQESRATTQCQDGVDNDSDGAIDLNDFSCGGDKKKDNEATPKAQCDDGIDNDSDGASDLADFSCQNNKQRNDEANPKAQCQDGTDNDGDGAIDLADFSCQNNRQRNDEANPKAQCQDGTDNDADGATDLADPGCTDANDNDESGEAESVKVNVSCVMDNKDGSYSAYFGYENPSKAEIQIVSAIGKTPETRNEVTPAPIQATAMTTFKPGIVNGAMMVVFDPSKPVTWTVRAAGSKVAVATASTASPACQKVTPVAECTGGTAAQTVARYGYSNPNGFDLVIPVGALNSFTPNPANRNQPVVLKSGTNRAVFETTYIAGSAWNLTGVSSQVSAATPACQECTPNAEVAIKGAVDVNAEKLANQVIKVANLLTAEVRKQAKARKLPASRAKRLLADAANSQKRAQEVARQVKDLTLGIPDVSVSCPYNKPFCATVDRAPVIAALNGLYDQMYVDLLKRLMARNSFLGTGFTKRGTTEVKEGESFLKVGKSELLKLAVKITVCK